MRSNNIDSSMLRARTVSSISDCRVHRGNLMSAILGEYAAWKLYIAQEDIRRQYQF